MQFLIQEIVLYQQSVGKTIEAVENTQKKFCIGVQWHPEREIDENGNRLISAFINASK